MRLVQALAIVLATTLGACSLLSSFEGYSTGAVASGGDGGIDGASGPSFPDAGTDVSTEAGGAGWCATHAPDAGFCADFDERGLELFDREVMENGTLGVDTLASRSPPGSLWAAAGSRKGSVESFLEKNIANDATSARIAFDLRIEGAHAVAAAEVMQLTFADGSREYTVGFAVTGGAERAYAYEYSADPALYQDLLFSKPVPLATWVRITLAVDLATKKVTVERDDEPGSATSALTAPFSGPLELEIGIAYTTAGEDAWKVRIDNVVVDAN